MASPAPILSCTVPSGNHSTPASGKSKTELFAAVSKMSATAPDALASPTTPRPMAKGRWRPITIPLSLTEFSGDAIGNSPATTPSRSAEPTMPMLPRFPKATMPIGKCINPATANSGSLSEDVVFSKDTTKLEKPPSSGIKTTVISPNLKSPPTERKRPLLLKKRKLPSSNQATNLLSPSKSKAPRSPPRSTPVPSLSKTFPKLKAPATSASPLADSSTSKSPMSRSTPAETNHSPSVTPNAPPATRSATPSKKSTASGRLNS